MVTVIGVDPSLQCTGVCVWVDGRVKTFSVKTSTDDHRVVRETRIAEAVLPYVDPRVPMLAIVEGVYQGGFGRTSLDLAGLHDVLVYEFHRRGVRIGVPAAKSVKLFATQNGNANKKDMVAFARTHLAVFVANHNEADALWMAAMGVVAMGGQVHNSWPPISDEPEYVAEQRVRAHALSKVTWIGGEPGLLLRGTGPWNNS